VIIHPLDVLLGRSADKLDGIVHVFDVAIPVPISLVLPPQVSVSLCVKASEARLIVKVTFEPILAEVLDTEKVEALGIVLSVKVVLPLQLGA
jgi:hypothetical protein